MKKIFIDPGHGGTDPGALGNGLKEKDITLLIALELKDILNRNYHGHMLKLSRETDKTISLPERTSMANNWQADYLMSIHVNAGGGTGFESFVFNQKLQRKKESKLYQTVIHNHVVQETQFNNRGTKQANFHMLRESKMPALLTENGFIDNKADSLLLKQPNFIKRIAHGHAAGLASALQLSNKTAKGHKPEKYVVVKGDTLWSIAMRHGVTVEELLERNKGIEPRRLQIGYELVIDGKKSAEHIIRKGDTFWELAKMYCTTVNDIQQLNPHLHPRRLLIGEKIKLP